MVGFAVAGLSGWTESANVLGLPIDPMANLIHLLLGWYLVHCVHLHDQLAARSVAGDRGRVRAADAHDG